MKRLRFFCSLYKERDYLEQMAEEGWLLENLTLGVLYHFKKIPPAQKVFEIERFGISTRPDKRELTARKTALDIAGQAGWEVVTHDEEMNYYFVKDRAGDESDEFFDDEESRMERAERYRRRYAFEQPFMLLVMLIAVSVIYALLFAVGVATATLWFYMACDLLILSCASWLIWWGQEMYEELGMTRSQWEKQKKFGVKKSFGRVGKMTCWLKEQEAKGLVLTDFKRGRFLFEEAAGQYDYFADTRHALSKRMKEQGARYRAEEKDWNGQSPKWYEMSMEQAEKAGFELVCTVERETLLYRREHSDQPVPFHTEKESMGSLQAVKTAVVSILAVFALAFVIGFAVGFLLR